MTDANYHELFTEACGVIACALADHDGWKQEATDFLIQHGEEAPETSAT